MKKRHLSRIIALAACYRREITNDLAKIDLKEIINEDLIHDLSQINDEVIQYANILIEGTLARYDEIINTLKGYLKNWKIERLSLVDKCILMIGIYELIYRWDVPYRVVIDEAIELAKEFSGDNSPAFVNGVLDSVRKDIEAGKIQKS